VHGQREASLEPLERVEGERRGKRRRLGGGGRDRKIKTGQKRSNREEKFKTGGERRRGRGNRGKRWTRGEKRGRKRGGRGRGREEERKRE
jgi:hypothetical protein